MQGFIGDPTSDSSKSNKTMLLQFKDRFNFNRDIIR